MGGADTIGGFFVELGLITDQNSFNAGQRKLKDFEASTKALLGTVVKTSAALFGMAVAAGEVESAELKVAKAIGVSVGSLDKWKVAAGVAGVSASSLTASMESLETKMRKLKMGDVDMSLARSLGMLGMGYGQFADMNADERMRSVFSRAGAMADQETGAQLVRDILGEGAQEYYYYLQLSGKTLDQQLSQAKMMTFTNERTKKEAMGFQGEVKAIFGSFKSIGALFGSELAGGLQPLVQQTKSYIIANRELIQTKVADFAHGTAEAFTRIFGMVEKVAPIVVKLVDGFGGLDGILVKVGIGIATLNLSRLGFGIAGVVKGLGVLKTAFTGLAMGAGFLILEDIFGYFTGKDSLIGHVINNIDEIKDEFKDVVPPETIQGIKNLIEDLTGVLKRFATDGVDTAIKLIGDLATLLHGLAMGDWEKVGKSLKKFIEDLGSGLDKIINGDNSSMDIVSTNGLGGAIKTTAKVLGGGGFEIAENQLLKKSIIDRLLKETNAWFLGTPSERKSVGELSPDLQALLKEWESKGGTLEPFKKYINDGIISPDGRVTQVAPDDWVFAVKDLGNVASAFIPQAIRNNSAQATQNISINQTITVSSTVRDTGAIRQAARQGASDGLRQAQRRNAEILHLMPGTL